MIRITDRTLSCLDNMPHDIPALSLFLRYLIKMEADAIELSEKMYRLLAPLPEYSSYVLRIDHPLAVQAYPDIRRFICRNAPDDPDGGMRAEVLLNDMREAYNIARYCGYKTLRLQGLDDILLGDYAAAFRHIKESFRGDVEFCPGDRFRFATALAAEWVISGAGDNLVTSFGGVGGFAPTEEVIMTLRLRRLRKVGKEYGFFPEMANLLSVIMNAPINGNKPVIGKRIFCVESGIHVDGIAKQPKCYEPFPPEVVGLSRKVIIGKQSGTASVRIRLAELGLSCDESTIPVILEHIKKTSTEKNCPLTDSEFTGIVRMIEKEVAGP